MCLSKEALQRQGAAREALGCSPFTPSLMPLKHCRLLAASLHHRRALNEQINAVCSWTGEE